MGAIQDTVRYLRRNATESERTFWRLVRNRQLAGLKFSRQIPFHFKINGRQRYVVVDFYCAEKNLAIEIDGGIHDRKTEMDAFRTVVLEALDVRVLRIGNEELEDTEAVKVRVLQVCGQGPDFTHPRGQLSRPREGAPEGRG